MRVRIALTAVIAVILTTAVHAASAKRALLIGINDYTASSLKTTGRAPAPGRDWPNLEGAVNDVDMMAGLLVSIHGFARADITTLTNQAATRNAIFREIRLKLAEPAKKGDVLLFYFSGHGSQVRNDSSRETDKLDESLVPADSRRGADDIRDKELRDALAEITRRGAQLTVILDACHSASGTRGIEAGRRARFVKPDLRDVADPSSGGDGGDSDMLVLSAALDFDFAYEMMGDGQVRGAFSWALARAMRDADPDEPASDTFLRAQARVQDEMASQVPVIAGSVEARLRPLFGSRVDRRNRTARVAVDKILGNNRYQLLGGWANGVTKETELRAVDHNGLRLKVTTLLGAGGCEAEVISDNPSPLAVGDLLEIARWVPPPGPPLRVWIPTMAADPLPAAVRLHEEAESRVIPWLADPLGQPPAKLLRWSGKSWELVANGRVMKTADTLAALPVCEPIFVQFPASAALAAAIGSVDGVERTSGPETADYMLVGRWNEGVLEYAWIRPHVAETDADRSAMPLYSRWVTLPDAGVVLHDDLIRLRRVFGWHQLTSPAAEGASYHLAVQSVRDGAFIRNGVLIGDEKYRLVLQSRPSAEPVYTRYVYVFVIDSAGNSALLFPNPDAGAVGNRLPLTINAASPVPDPPKEIVLRDPDGFVVEAPYGLDTYVLLSTDEPLPTPASLEWRGVRAPLKPPTGPLEKLLRLGIVGTRQSPEQTATPTHWSIEKIAFRSVPPAKP